MTFDLRNRRTEKRGDRRGRPYRRSIAGQSIILAVMVMFLLMFLGGIFIALLRRNLVQTEYGAQQLNAQQLAEAGVQFANDQLTTSVEGADWRPAPTSPTPQPGRDGCSDEIAATTLDPQDPDFRWLREWAPNESGQPYTIDDTRAVPQVVNGQRVYPKIQFNQRGPTGGFTRVEYGGGRFLIRVTYNPNNDPALGPIAPDAATSGQPSPLSRYLRIESVGREGIVDPDDPTTYVQQTLRRELVAFKPIGIVDYVRFITDRQRSGVPFTLGASRFPLIDRTDEITSDVDAVNAGVPGLTFSSENPPAPQQPGHVHDLNTLYGPVRSNGGLRVRGLPKIVLNQNPGSTQPTPDRGDRIEIVGEITRATENTPGMTDDSNLAIQAPGLPPGTRLWNGSAVNTQPITQGLLVQGTNRIEAPDLEAVEPNARAPRYRLLTRFSTPALPGLSPTQSEVAARNGLGAGIFIDNAGQRQTDTGRFTVQEDWMQPANNVTSNWTGHIYNPPGVRIQLIPHSLLLPRGTLVDGKEVTDADGLRFENGLIRISRSDRTWRIPDPDNPNNREGIDTDRFNQYFQFPLAPGETAPNPNFPPAFANGVIFAEGNVRIWGKLPRARTNPCATNASNRFLGQNLTIVSSGTIYVEGSLLKGDGPNAGMNMGGEDERYGGIALLANDYVTINPTAYFTNPPETNSGDWSTYQGDWYNTLYLPPQDRYGFYVQNSVNPNAYPADSTSVYPAPQGAPPISGGVQQELYTQASGESTPGSGVVLQVNNNAHPWWEATSQMLYGHYLPGRQWTHEVTPLHPQLGNDWSTSPEIPNWLQFSYRALTPAWISKVAVAPLDVRIEAAMYAMNGSFFMIPGVPFNNDAIDSRATFVEDGGEQRHGGLTRLSPKSAYPFAKEPLDIKVTIVGSIAENKPAPENAQEAWARLWGWTPLKKGSGAPTAHGGDGLSIQFDPSLRSIARFDPFGRPLPLMPRLPVSPDLVYYGEAQ